MISVIIPMYNGEKYISEAIESVLNQTVSDIEIIVVDDGSTDSGAEVVKRYSKVRYVYQKNGGVSKARNLGVRIAKGELIAFLDCDDYYSSSKLEKQLECMNSNREIEVCFCRYKNFYDNPDLIDDNQRRVYSTIIDYCLASALIKKSVFERCGYFDSDLIFGEDSEWVNRALMLENKKCYLMNEELYFRRIRGGSLTTSRDLSTSTLVEVTAKSAGHSFLMSKGMKLDIVILANNCTDFYEMAHSAAAVNWLGEIVVTVVKEKIEKDELKILEEFNINYLEPKKADSLISNSNSDFLYITASDLVNDVQIQKLYSIMRNSKESIVYGKNDLMVNNRKFVDSNRIHELDMLNLIKTGELI